MDRFYTPQLIVRELLDSVDGGAFDCLADFAAGRGTLLTAAAARWPGAQVVANDRDGRMTSFLDRHYPHWTVLQNDFLDSRDSRLALVLRRIRRKRTLVLLNPPFSCRGAKRHTVDVGGRRLTCSLALAFLLRAAAAVGMPGSQIACVLPAGSLSAEKDHLAWGFLRESFAVHVVAAYERFTFPDCHPRTAAVRLVSTASQSSTEMVSSGLDRERPGSLDLVRGWVQMHSKDLRSGARCLRLVHTTDMRGEEVALSDDWVWTDRNLSGPAVLIPRVGQPRPDKVVLWAGSEDIALSDCVIALKAPTPEIARRRRDEIVKCWPVMECCYTGTGARYITLKGLAAFLRHALNPHCL